MHHLCEDRKQEARRGQKQTWPKKNEHFGSKGTLVWMQEVLSCDCAGLKDSTDPVSLLQLHATADGAAPSQEKKKKKTSVSTAYYRPC